MELFVFLVAGGACIAGALGVVLNSNPVHAALSLVGTLFGIAAVASTTMTVTVGLVTYALSAVVIVSRSSTGVWSAASRSPTSGSVIRPSGRTCTDCESCASL